MHPSISSCVCTWEIYFIFQFCKLKFLDDLKIPTKAKMPNNKFMSLSKFKCYSLCVEPCQFQVTLVRTLSSLVDQVHTHMLHKNKMPNYHPENCASVSHHTHIIHPKRSAPRSDLKILHLQEKAWLWKWKWKGKKKKIKRRFSKEDEATCISK